MSQFQSRDPLILICPSCGQRNRTSEERLAYAVCGKCHTLLTAKPSSSRRFTILVVASILLLSIISIWAFRKSGEIEGTVVQQNTPDSTTRYSNSNFPKSIPSSATSPPPFASPTSSPASAENQPTVEDLDDAPGIEDDKKRLRDLQKQRRKEKSKEAQQVLDLEIDQVRMKIADKIRLGPHGDLPAPEVTSNRGTRRNVALTITNKTSYQLTVILTGTKNLDINVPPGKSRSVTTEAGEYRVAASVNASDVLPFYGNWTLDRLPYATDFYIESTFSPR